MTQREYRGQHIDTKEWVYGWYLVDDQQSEPRHCIWTRENAGDFIANNLIQVDPDTVGQYTGEKDNDSREIFGNSQIEINYRTEDGWMSYIDTVVFENGSYILKGEKELLHDVLIRDVVKVFDHPQLLKGDTV
ncbi:YopX family protein [Paenibacillus sp. GCM10027627]|uniref:YopX family protein n=1 Tax=unclassified Paenibacillus TaxID=185978 RepID=UPI00363F6052